MATWQPLLVRGDLADDPTDSETGGALRPVPEWEGVFRSNGDKSGASVKDDPASSMGKNLGRIMSAPLGSSFDFGGDGTDSGGFKVVVNKKSRRHRSLVAKKEVEENSVLSGQLNELVLFWSKDVVLSRGKYPKLSQETVVRTVDQLRILLGFLQNHLGPSQQVDLWALAEAKNLEDAINFLCVQKNKRGETLGSGTITNYCEAVRRLLIFLHAKSVTMRSEGQQPARNVGISVSQLEGLVQRIKLVRNTVARDYEKQRKNSDTREEMIKRGTFCLENFFKTRMQANTLIGRKSLKILSNTIER
jgi:hypothetical protein